MGIAVASGEHQPLYIWLANEPPLTFPLRCLANEPVLPLPEIPEADTGRPLRQDREQGSRLVSTHSVLCGSCPLCHCHHAAQRIWSPRPRPDFCEQLPSHGLCHTPLLQR